MCINLIFYLIYYMGFFVKHKFSYYRKYKFDIWGFYSNTLQVSHDDTRYNVFKLNVFLWGLKSDFKKTNWLYKKFKQLFETNRLKKEDELLALNINFNEINNNYDKYLILRIYLIIKLINILNIINHFMKQTVSDKQSKMIYVMALHNLSYIQYKRTFFKRPFIYESRIPTGFQKKKRVKSEHSSFRILRLFYVMYNYRQLIKIGKKAKAKSGVFEQNFLSIIEAKLPSFLYRTAFFPTVFDSIGFVKYSNVWINKKYKPLVYYTVNLFDFVGFRPFYKSYVVWSFFKRLRRRAFLFMFSRCLYASLRFTMVITISRFTKMDLVNSFNFDYFRIINHIQ